MKKITFVIYVLLFLVPPCAFATTRYVDASPGSNCSGNYSIANRNCSGSDGNSYTTIAAGLAATVTGDTLNIRSGTYNEQNMSFGSNFASMVTIRGYSNERPVINRISECYQTISLNGNSNNITFYNLKFTAPTQECGDTYDYETLGNSSSGTGYIVIDDCEFDGTGFCHVRGGFKFWIKNCKFVNWGIQGTRDHAIYSYGSHTSGNEAIFENNYFNNTVGSNIGAGVHLYNGGNSCSYNIVRYNIFNGDMFWGVLLACGYSQIYGNTIYNTAKGLMFYQSQCDYNTVKNNIFDNNDTDFELDHYGQSCPGGDACVGTHNTVETNFLGSSTKCVGCGGDYATYDDDFGDASNPFLVSSPANWYDFRLSATATTTINSGDNLGSGKDGCLSPTDITWPPTALDQDDYGAWEIGAFCYSSASTVPTVTGVSISGGSLY